MKVEGWILDAYAGDVGEMVIWLKTREGLSIRLVDRWQNAVYVSCANHQALEYLASRKDIQQLVSSYAFVKKRVEVYDYEERDVLQLVLRRADDTERLSHTIEKVETYEEYRIYNANLLPAQAYFIGRDLFPLAKVRAEQTENGVRWQLLDSTMAEDYELPPLRRAELRVEIAASRIIPTFEDPIKRITLPTGEVGDQEASVEEKNEAELLLSVAARVRELDPDLLFVDGGDDFTMHYLAERAYRNGVLNQFILSRDPVPLRRLQNRGTSYFAYGRILYTPTSHVLYGRSTSTRTSTSSSRAAAWRASSRSAASAGCPCTRRAGPR